MDNTKNNKGVITLLIIIIVILSTLCILLTVGTITFKSSDVDNNNKENDNITNNINDLKVGNQTSTSIEFRKGKYINIRIDNGKIVFLKDSKQFSLSNYNAKYFYLHTYMEICSTNLYFIDNNNTLYKTSISPLVCEGEFSEENLNVVKVTDSKVTDFLGTGYTYSKEDYETYHTINYLIKGGVVESLVIGSYSHQQ